MFEYLRPFPVTDSEMNDGTVTGTIFDIQRFSVNDGPGIRTIVFCKSCPLECLWCSNPESRNSTSELLYTESRCLQCGACVSVCPTGALTPTDEGISINRVECDVCGGCSQACPSGALRVAGQTVNVDGVLAKVERDHIFYEHSGGGMTLSGGEPLSQPGFAIALLQGARQLGIHTAVETSGSTSEQVVRQVLSQTDLILYDIKQITPEKHLAGTGKRNTSILRNARVAAGLGVEMIIRVPVIPGFNDTLDDLRAIGELTRDLGLPEIHLLPYHRYGLAKYASLGKAYPLANTPLLPESALDSVRTSLQALGLRVRVGG
jgi:pyruvate formate lyase activating enzyme